MASLQVAFASPASFLQTRAPVAALQRCPARVGFRQSSGCFNSHRGLVAATTGILGVFASRRCRSLGTSSHQRRIQRFATASGGEFDTSEYYAAKGDAATKEWVMQQTMMRVKDPKRSLDFYTKVLGMQLICESAFPQWGFTVYFVGYPPKDLGPVPEDPGEKFAYCMRVPGCIELTWNHGSEADDAERVYNTGNSDSTGSKDGSAVKGGFGHIGITVPDVYEACERFHEMGAEFHKSPNAGGMKGLAFVKDPDGYLVEVLPLGKGFPFPTKETDCCGVSLDGSEGYKDNSKA
mmetsp:Transcript_29729/g.68437  ORF Transcript_29729/g.68437 Transcript_29729/m.68437 type:complete len:293 (+) Transcript_29729:86-964(+)